MNNFIANLWWWKMEKLDKLGEWPSGRILKILLIISIIISVLFTLLMRLPLTISGFPANYVVPSEVCFSGPFLKALYAYITNLGAYVLFEGLDFGFMAGYGLLIFSLALIIGRGFDDGTNWRKSGYIIAISGIVAAGCDVGENTFIMLTLTDPLNFPDIWATIHSAFSVIKWILIFIALTWAIITVIVKLTKKA